MGRIISLISGKGGVGKTMFTANLGIALSQAGFRVCLVDADIAMANLSLLLGMQASPITLHEVLLGEADLNDAIYDGPAGVSFVPSGLSLESYRRVDSDKMTEIIKPLARQYDFVLLDSPPGISKDAMSALAVAEESLMITMPTSPAIADLLKVKMVAQRLGNKPLGVVVNCVRREKGEIKEEEIMKMLELPVYGNIPFDDSVRKSFLQERVMPVMLREANAKAAKAIRLIAEKLSGVKISKEKSAPKTGLLKQSFPEKAELEREIAKPAPEKKGFFSRIFGFFKR